VSLSPLRSQIRVLSPRALVDETVVHSLLPVSRRGTRTGSSFAVALREGFHESVFQLSIRGKWCVLEHSPLKCVSDSYYSRCYARRGGQCQNLHFHDFVQRPFQSFPTITPQAHPSQLIAAQKSPVLKFSFPSPCPSTTAKGTQHVINNSPRQMKPLFLFFCPGDKRTTPGLHCLVDIRSLRHYLPSTMGILRLRANFRTLKEPSLDRGRPSTCFLRNIPYLEPKVPSASVLGKEEENSTLSLPIIYLSLIQPCLTNWHFLVSLQVSHPYAELGRSFHPFLDGSIILGTCSTVCLLFSYQSFRELTTGPRQYLHYVHLYSRPSLSFVPGRMLFRSVPTVTRKTNQHFPS